VGRGRYFHVGGRGSLIDHGDRGVNLIVYDRRYKQDKVELRTELARESDDKVKQAIDRLEGEHQRLIIEISEKHSKQLADLRKSFSTEIESGAAAVYSPITS
jgi:hypothetical protein